MTQFLPPNLLALFAPREPIPYLPPLEKLPFEKKTTGYTGIAELIHLFEVSIIQFEVKDGTRDAVTAAGKLFSTEPFV